MSEADIEDIQERFLDARERYEAARAAVDEIGEAELETLVERLRRVDRLLETYEDRATGSGDFGGYITFRNEISSFVEGLPEDAIHRDVFEDVDDIADQRRLSTKDFADARERLSEVRETAERLEELEQAREAFRDRRREVLDRLDALEARIATLDRVLELGKADVDAPVEELRDPIESYNDAVTSAFRAFQRDAPAVEVLSLFALTDRYPLVPMSAPPERLQRYVERELPDATITDLLEYADYSRSKLSHYVADPAAFKAAVATEQTYLERLDASPFEVPWPPPEAAELRWRVRELISVIDRFAPASVVGDLRAVRGLTRDTERFERLRAAAEAREELTPTQREKLVAGTVADERAAATEAHERLRELLADAPNP